MLPISNMWLLFMPVMPPEPLVAQVALLLK